MTESKLMELEEKIDEMDRGRLEKADRLHEILKRKDISAELRNELEPLGRYIDTELSDLLDEAYLLIQDRMAESKLEGSRADSGNPLVAWIENKKVQ
jgi:hypothetical protein